MSDGDIGARFTGSIPKLYEACLVPMLFEPYARDLVERLGALPATRVLEIAAGTGIVTRTMASSLPPTVSIVATDLNQPMLDHAARVGTAREVEWRQADAMQLPFDDASFDAVVCQFGVMFFPDRAKAYSEVRRVLRPGGTLLFNAWDRIEENDFAHSVQSAVDTVFPADPPRFLVRIPHGYFECSLIAQDLRNGGFAKAPAITTLAARSRAESARSAATGYCHGTPLRNEIEARDPSRLAEATDLAEKLIAQRFGPGPIDGKIQAHVFAIAR